MHSKTAIGFGIIMLIVGVLGFMPGITDINGHLLGLFHVNTAHNLIHLLTGAVAIGCGLGGLNASRIFFRVFGVVYGLVALVGFVTQDEMLFGIIANNTADNWLHLGIAAGSLVLGFVPVWTSHAETMPHRPPTPLTH